MTDETEILLEEDEAPKSGEWVDICDTIRNPTPGEYTLGQKLGEQIDPEDDNDDGSSTVGTMSKGSGSSEFERAMGKARLLKKVMLDQGVPEVSIETRAGRPSDYGLWDSMFTVAEFSHHTVSRLGSNLTPCLALVKYGRSDLPGPLCNGYGGWDLCYRIITFGYANHPGTGGAYTVPARTAGKFTIPRDSARRYAWGTEWEGGLSESEWDKTLKNPRNGKTMNFREFMGRSNLALEIFHEIAEGAHLEHSTWTSRKIDRLGYTREEGIAEKNRYRGKEEPDKRFPDRPTIDLDNIITEFKKAKGQEKGKPIRRMGVRRIQGAFGMPETGLVDAALLERWGKFETRMVQEKKITKSGARQIPDPKSMNELATRKKWNVS